MQKQPGTERQVMCLSVFYSFPGDYMLNDPLTHRGIKRKRGHGNLFTVNIADNFDGS